MKRLLEKNRCIWNKNKIFLVKFCGRGKSGISGYNMNLILTSWKHPKDLMLIQYNLTMHCTSGWLSIHNTNTNLKHEGYNVSFTLCRALCMSNRNRFRAEPECKVCERKRPPTYLERLFIKEKNGHVWYIVEYSYTSIYNRLHRRGEGRWKDKIQTLNHFFFPRDRITNLKLLHRVTEWRLLIACDMD